MNISLKDYHRIPTYTDLIQEAVIHPTETIKYPNIIATQLRNTPQLTRFDDEIVLDISNINSSDMTQTIQQTAVQRALQPVARSIPTGLKQFYMADTEEAIQEQLDEGTVAEASTYTKFKNKRAKLLSIVEEEQAEPGQIEDMIASSSASASGSTITPIIQS